MGNLVLRQVRIPMDENTNHTWKAVRYRNFAGTKHRDKSPAHLTGALRGEGGSEIVCHGEDGAGYIFRHHAFVLRQNLFEQFAGGSQDKFWFIGGDGCCTTNPTDWHGWLP